MAAAFWALGLLLAFHPMLLTALARMQGAPVDTRLNNYVLENEYLWASSAGHRSLWNAGFFFPARNVAPFGDIQLGSLPFYAPWRMLGSSYDTAFQLWCMTILSLDFAAFWFLLRRAMGTSALAAGFGAFLFAFGAPRVNQAGHEQLLSHFYVITALYALYRIFARDRLDSSASGSTRWVIVFFASLVAQLYTGFYASWFVLFALLIACMWAGLLPSYRAIVIPIVRRRWPALVAGGALAVLAVAPLCLHYFEAARVVGMREWRDVEPMLPRPQSWFYLGPFSRLYRWQSDLAIFRSLVQDQEHRLGVGVATTLVAAIGLYRGWKDPGTRLLVLVAGTLALSATVPFGDWVWRLVFETVPGASAIRAVARIGMLMLIPIGIGAAYFVDAMRPHRVVLALLVAVSILEQAQTTPSYDKHAVRNDVESLASKVDPTCGAFLFTPLAGSGAGRSGFEHGKHQADAMWAGLLTNVPTINGLSGNSPAGWDFFDPTVRDEADERRIDRALHEWCSRSDLDATRVCWIRTPVDWSWSMPQEPLLREMRRRWRAE